MQTWIPLVLSYKQIRVWFLINPNEILGGSFLFIFEFGAWNQIRGLIHAKQVPFCWATSLESTMKNEKSLHSPGFHSFGINLPLGRESESSLPLALGCWEFGAPSWHCHLNSGYFGASRRHFCASVQFSFDERSHPLGIRWCSCVSMWVT